jgi:predicted protein tyrosine phosphatase
MTLIVSPLSHVERVVATRKPSHLISLLDPEWMIETPTGVAPGRHLKLSIHDIEAPFSGMTAPSAAVVEQILAFAEDWDVRSPMLIHCWAGISRSTATAFTLACARDPSADEMEIALRMRAAAPHAQPNRRIVALADDILGRRGRMLEALDAMGANDFSTEGAPFDLAARPLP